MSIFAILFTAYSYVWFKLKSQVSFKSVLLQARYVHRIDKYEVFLKFYWMKGSWHAIWQLVSWDAKKISKIYIFLSIIFPSHIYLALFLPSIWTWSAFYSVHANITLVYRGFLPGLLPPSKASLCSLRGGKAWQVRRTKTDASKCHSSLSPRQNSS